MGSSSRELFLNLKPSDIPNWDGKKHYFEQEKSTFQFWESEFDKIKNGVTVGGYFFHPLLYFMINHFQSAIPTLDEKGVQFDKVQTLPFDDNVLFLTESYQEAQIAHKGLGLFGTRGFAKSTFITAINQWKLLINPTGTCTILSASSADIDTLKKSLTDAFTYIHPAFRLNFTKTAFDGGTSTVGYKRSISDEVLGPSLKILNAEPGKASKSEIGAGINPINFTIDEFGKEDFSKVLQTNQAAFYTNHGAKFVYLLSGTAGNEKLTKSAIEVITHPDDWKLLPMNWDRLERGIPEEYITWHEDRGKPFSIFVPAQMSYRIDRLEKVEKDFGDFIGVKSKILSEIPFKVTNWQDAKKKIDIQVLSKTDELLRAREKNYFPLNIGDIYSTAQENPFPKHIVKRTIDRLKAEEKFGRKVEFFRDGSKIKYEFSSKKMAEISHKGGMIDSPIVMYEDFTDKNYADNTNTAGIDNYKTAQSTTSSLGAMYILGRRGLSPDSFTERILACYTSRPQKHEDLHSTFELMLDAYHSKAMIETPDVGFEDYLRHKDRQGQLLVPKFSFSKQFQLQTKFTAVRALEEFGMSANKINNDHRMELMIKAAWEEFVVGFTEAGDPIKRYGCEYWEDIPLLEEMLLFPNGNFDRIDAFSYALVQARELDKKKIVPVDDETKRLQEMMFQKNRMEYKEHHSPYRGAGNRRSPYRN